MVAFLSWILLTIFIITLQEPIFCFAKNMAMEEEMVPYIEAGEKGEIDGMKMMLNERRRKLGGSFQICSVCTCCSGVGANHYCLAATPCCYAINCNIPNRPFGYCSFTPKTCNCLQCHL